MPEISPEYGGETPSVEVRVYRDGRLIERELCEDSERVTACSMRGRRSTESNARSTTSRARHRPGDVLEPESEEVDVEPGYPHEPSRREAER